MNLAHCVSNKRFERQKKCQTFDVKADFLLINFLTTLFKKQSLFGVFFDFPYSQDSFKEKNVCNSHRESQNPIGISMGNRLFLTN